MQKKLIVLGLCLMLALSTAACGTAGTTAPAGGSSAAGDGAASGDSPAAGDSSASVAGSYQDILDDYSQQLKDAVPGLIEEYKAEAAGHEGDINTLASISNDKIEELAKISNDGIQEMAQLMFKNGDDQETYEDWAQKLMDVYMDEAQKITDAYMESATP